MALRKPCWLRCSWCCCTGVLLLAVLRCNALWCFSLPRVGRQWHRGTHGSAVVEQIVHEIYGAKEGGPSGLNLPEASVPRRKIVGIDDVRSAEDLEVAAFNFEYVKAKRPVLLRGVDTLMNWPPQSMWEGPKATQIFNGLQLRVSLGTAFPLQAGGHVAQPVKSFEDIMSKYLQDNRLFVFDSDVDRTMPLAKQMPVPDWLSLKHEDATSIVSLGGRGAGLSWHTHGPTWLAAVVGRKRWFLYPPGQASSRVRGHPLYSASAWACTILPQLPPSKRPLTILQEPGEILYLPAGWAHSTVNLDDALGFGRQNPLSEEEGDHAALAYGIARGYPASEADPEACTLLAIAGTHKPELLPTAQDTLTPAKLLMHATQSAPLYLPAVIAFARDADGLAPEEGFGACILRRAVEVLSDEEPLLASSTAFDNATLALAWVTLARNLAAAATSESDRAVAADCLAHIPRLVDRDLGLLEFLGVEYSK